MRLRRQTLILSKKNNTLLDQTSLHVQTLFSPKIDVYRIYTGLCALFENIMMLYRDIDRKNVDYLTVLN